jgi:hypothetical protein
MSAGRMKRDMILLGGELGLAAEEVAAQLVGV